MKVFFDKESFAEPIEMDLSFVPRQNEVVRIDNIDYAVQNVLHYVDKNVVFIYILTLEEWKEYTTGISSKVRK